MTCHFVCLTSINEVPKYRTPKKCAFLILTESSGVLLGVYEIVAIFIKGKEVNRQKSIMIIRVNVKGNQFSNHVLIPLRR
jgi:hypothetical protein